MVKVIRHKKHLYKSDLTLEQWLELMEKHPKNVLFQDYQFPTEKIKEQFLTTIFKYSEKTIAEILNSFLPPSGTLKADQWGIDLIKSLMENNIKELHKFIEEEPYFKRLLEYMLSNGKTPLRDSINWIIDLLPLYPRKALDVLDAYVTAHILYLPDGRIHGLSDAKAILRTRYFSTDGKVANSVLKSLNPIDLEHLVEALYKAMDYKTEMTKPSYDGGRDVIATKDIPGKKEKNLIQCKKWQDVVGVEDVRNLHGVIADDKATKGTLITTSHFSTEAEKWANRNPQIELIAIKELQELLNEHLGVNWITNTDKFISASKGRHPLECVVRRTISIGKELSASRRDGSLPPGSTLRCY